MGRRTKVRICQQAVLPAIIRFREGRRARVECPRAVVDFCVYLRVSLAASNNRQVSLSEEYNMINFALIEKLGKRIPSARWDLNPRPSVI